MQDPAQLRLKDLWGEVKSEYDLSAIWKFDKNKKIIRMSKDMFIINIIK